MEMTASKARVMPTQDSQGSGSKFRKIGTTIRDTANEIEKFAD